MMEMFSKREDLDFSVKLSRMALQQKSELFWLLLELSTIKRRVWGKNQFTPLFLRNLQVKDFWQIIFRSFLKMTSQILDQVQDFMMLSTNLIEIELVPVSLKLIWS